MAKSHFTDEQMPLQVFGYLTPVSKIQGSKNHKWHCVCKCGARTETGKSALISGNTKSCGCWKREKASARSFKHGQSRYGLTKTSEYEIWLGMRKRCNNPKCKAYHNYGGRGIAVCARWDSFENFFADMGRRPSPKHTLDRIDNNGNYEPLNCQWATRREQANNQRKNRLLTRDGRTMTASEWARELGVEVNTLYARLNIYGWSVSDVLSPLRRSRHLMLTFNGDTKRLRDWASETGISRAVLYRRIYRLGWPLEKAFGVPVNGNH